MAGKTYAVTPTVRLVNGVVSAALRMGVKLPHNYLLTVRGRKTGKLYTTPVTLVEEGGNRWLVGPYGDVAWVKNARASGEVMLTRGSKTEMLGIREVPPAERAPILKAYLGVAPTVLPYFDAAPDSPVEAFAAEAERHPVFLLTAK